MRGGLLAAASILFAFACDSSVSSSLEHKECTSHGECLPGWMCSEDQICERMSPPARGDSQGADRDAGTVHTDAMVVTGVGPTIPCEDGMVCEGSCVDIQHDVAHCGGCGRRCANVPDGEAACKAGSCELVCGDGYTRCGDGCYRLNDHVEHCGSCDEVCPSVTDGAPLCAAGKCETMCNSGFARCGDACVRTDTDVHHCGKCGNVCPEGDQCAAGKCVRACPTGTIECSRSCVDPANDLANCGGCGTACATTAAPINSVPVCRDKVCGFDCKPGLTRCDDACVDLQTDLLNCGGCAKVCPFTTPRSHPVCAAGGCDTECNLGYVACEEHCISLQLLQQRNARNTCAVLAMQQDRAMCQNQGQNSTFCGNECVNVQTDKRHCGRCNRACADGQSCFASTCLNFNF